VNKIQYVKYVVNVKKYAYLYCFIIIIIIIIII